jgi:hypothetical protein
MKGSNVYIFTSVTLKISFSLSASGKKSILLESIESLSTVVCSGDSADCMSCRDLSNTSFRLPRNIKKKIHSLTIIQTPVYSKQNLWPEVCLVWSGFTLYFTVDSTFSYEKYHRSKVQLLSDTFYVNSSSQWMYFFFLYF